MSDTYFTDIHNHIIFSVDDGIKSLDKSIRMLEQAVACNICQIATTPHVSNLADTSNIDRINRHFDQLKDAVSKKSIPVDIFLGAELMYNDRAYDLKKVSRITINGNQKYFLFELSLFALPTRVGEFIFQAKLKGLEPVLAHPERYFYLHKNIDQLLRWRQQGCLMQMNAGSLTGQFGKEVVSITKKLLTANFYTFAASDAHDIKSRNFKVLTKAYEIANQLISAEKAEHLFKINPDKAVKGKSISQEHMNENKIEKKWLIGKIKSIKNFKFG